MIRPILVTGAAGFIGFHVAQRLLRDGHSVVGLDNFNPYYDVALKRARWTQLESQRGFVGAELDVCDVEGMAALFARFRPGRIIHLAAQAGVRHSIENPRIYVSTNVVGFTNILEEARRAEVDHLIYASTSSIYGANTRTPFREDDPADHQLSLYAATKKANESMAHAYAHLFGLPVTGLRFFTVYGPWGRPDMAPILFARAVLEGRPLQLFNNGDMSRDFTYIDDIVEGVVRVADKPATGDPQWSGAAPNPGASRAPWRLFNIGDENPVVLKRFLALIEEAAGRKAIVESQPAPRSDAAVTHADISALRAWVGFEPRVSIEEGVRKLVAWVREYYRL